MTNIVETLHYIEGAALKFRDPEAAVGVIELLRQSDLNAEFFFTKLQDPCWIENLRGRGFFEATPDKRTNEDGSVSHPHSPALAALARLAPVVQKTAVAIYSRIDTKGNVAVADQVLRGIAEIKNPDLIPGLVPVVCRYLSPASQSTWIWLNSILRAWLEAGARDPLIEILATILDLSLGASNRRSQESWHVSEIDREIIAPLSHQWPEKLMECVFLALCRWAAAARREERVSEQGALPGEKDLVDPDCDLPNTYWLESFKVGFLNRPDPKGIIGHRLFVIGRQAFESSNQESHANFDTLLRSDRWQLFQRIRWQLYADYPTKSHDLARKDTLERIPLMGLARCYHNYEFAQMLEAHAQTHAAAFLKPDEVDSFVREVLSGPRGTNGATADADYRDHFQRRQLHPIRSLLDGEGLAVYDRLSRGKRELKQPDYKPISSGVGGTVQFVPPKRADEMHSMSDEELWTFLNTWEPTQRFPDPDNWLVEEDAGALGFKFSEYLETHPERFLPERRWWENLRRPAMLYKPLERATQRIGKKLNDGESPPLAPSEADWRNWFAIAAWITEQRPIVPAEEADKTERPSQEQLDWNWPRIVVVKFLTTALESVFDIPEEVRPNIGRLLRKLVEEDDPCLAAKDRPWIDDWLNTAINSVRGTALEGLIDLAVSQKKENAEVGPEPWIFEVIKGSLRHPDQSPAVFAILGARTGLFLHLFGKGLGDATELLLPPDRHDCGAAFIMAHYHYHSALPSILKHLPALPNTALKCLISLTEENEERRRARKDYGGKLGFHFAFYYWNNSFESEEAGDAILDRFFKVAAPGSRGMTVGEIGRIFESANREPQNDALFERVTKLWDRRLSYIEQLINSRLQPATDFQDELSAFTDWMACECFRFDWRYDRTMRAINRLEKSPQVYSLIETLDRISGSGEHLHEAMMILFAVIGKAGDELRWAYREERLKPVLRRGLSSTHAETKKLAEEIQESLLRHGCFEYLDLEENNPAVDPQ
jgi:hypothetical protein